MDTLANLDTATKMLAEARTLDDVQKIMDIAEAARTYARAARLGLEAQNHAAEIKLRAERKAGEMLARLERGTPKPYSRLEDGCESPYRAVLTEQDIPTTTAHRWQAVASIPELRFNEHIEERKAAREELTTASLLKSEKMPHVSYNSGEQEWRTPSEYIEVARRVMGGIDTDPASSELANQTIMATVYFDAETDGLTQEWHGRVWMNPPYSSGLVDKFCAKLKDSFRHGAVTEAIVLVNNATETQWFGDLVSIASAIVFTRGRVRFLNTDGIAGTPLQGQAIVYIGNSPELFTSVFESFGWSCTL